VGIRVELFTPMQKNDQVIEFNAAFGYILPVIVDIQRIGPCNISTRYTKLVFRHGENSNPHASYLSNQYLLRFFEILTCTDLVDTLLLQSLNCRTQPLRPWSMMWLFSKQVTSIPIALNTLTHSMEAPRFGPHLSIEVSFSIRGHSRFTIDKSTCSNSGISSPGKAFALPCQKSGSFRHIGQVLPPMRILIIFFNGPSQP